MDAVRLLDGSMMVVDGRWKIKGKKKKKKRERKRGAILRDDVRVEE